MANMIPISTVTVGSGGAAGIDFVGISQNYTDLLVMVSLRAADSVNLRGLYFQFNGVGSAYSYRQLYGFNSSAGSFTESSIATAFGGTMPGASNTTSTFANIGIYISNYTSSSNKSYFSDSVAENNASTNWQSDLVAGLWANTNPINRIYLYASAGNLAQYSSATLYGIRKY